MKTKRKEISTVVVKFGTFTQQKHDEIFIRLITDAIIRSGRRVDVYERKSIKAPYEFLAHTIGTDKKDYKLVRTHKSRYDFAGGAATARMWKLVEKFQRFLEECNKERVVINIDNFK